MFATKYKLIYVYPSMWDRVCVYACVCVRLADGRIKHYKFKIEGIIYRVHVCIFFFSTKAEL